MASDLIDHNPMLKKPAMAVLSVCLEHEGASRAVVEERAAEAWEETFRLVPASVVDALVREGCLDEQITVDGEPYAGTLEDAYADDSVADDSEIDALLTVTEAGRRLVEDYAPEATLAALMADRPVYIPVFESVLAACAESGGAGRARLESLIDERIAAERIESVSGSKVYPQYFLDALESAGGIEWDGAWRATEAGRRLIS